jgi:hypothetical protein
MGCDWELPGKSDLFRAETSMFHVKILHVPGYEKASNHPLWRLLHPSLVFSRVRAVVPPLSSDANPTCLHPHHPLWRRFYKNTSLKSEPNPLSLRDFSRVFHTPYAPWNGYQHLPEQNHPVQVNIPPWSIWVMNHYQPTTTINTINTIHHYHNQPLLTTIDHH